MKFALHLSPPAQERLKKLLQAGDKELLSNLRTLGVTEMRCGVETIKIPAKPTFFCWIWVKWEKILSKLHIKQKSQRQPRPATAPARALEILGMLIESREAMGTAARTRFIIALEQAAETSNLHTLEFLEKAITTREVSVATLLRVASLMWMEEMATSPGGNLNVSLELTANKSEKVESNAEPITTMERPREGRDWLSYDVASSVQERGESPIARQNSVEFGVHALFEAVSASPLAQADLRLAVSSLDSMQTASFQSCNSGSSEDAIVIVREAVGRLVEVSEQKPEVVQQALGQLASAALSPLPELQWQLKRGPLGTGSSAYGGPTLANKDIAWDLLTNLALSAVGLGVVSPPAKPETPEQVTQFLRKDVAIITGSETGVLRYVNRALQVLEKGAKEISRQVEYLMQPHLEVLHLGDSIVVIRESNSLRDDEMLQFRIATRVVASAGNLNWHDCLALVNARARYHQFLDADDPRGETDLRHQVMTSEGSLVVHVSIKHRRLSNEFREHYERQKLSGRIRVLSELVEFAKSKHTTSIRISAEQIAKQTEIDNEELLRAIRGKTAS